MNRTLHHRWISLTVIVVLAASVAACCGRCIEQGATPQPGPGTEPVGTEPTATTIASAPSAFAFTAEQNKETVTVPAGTQFTLALAENPTTGYSWALELSSGLSVVSDAYQTTPGREGMPGAGGTHTWTIEATTAGTQTIDGHYRRPWENPPVDAETFALTVEVP
jgi:inhibitor of cysteine peptidase